MMGSEVDLAVESILPKECPNVSVDVSGSNLMSELTGSMIFRVSPRLHSPCLSLEQSVAESPPNNSDTSLLSTPRINLDASESCLRCEPSSAGVAPNSYAGEEASDAEAINCAYRELIDEAILGVAFDVHRLAKCGLMFLVKESSKNADKYKIVDEFQMLNSNVTDIFGQNLGGGTTKSSKYIQQADCLCPECNQPTAACRFAPHLEKCMGMGRNSFRKARTRLAASCNNNNAISSASTTHHFGAGKSSSQSSLTTRNSAKSSWSDVDDEDVDDDDDDWFSSKKKGHKKRLVPRSVKKKTKNTPLKKKPSSSASLLSLRSGVMGASLLDDNSNGTNILLSELLDTPPLFTRDDDGASENSDRPRFTIGDSHRLLNDPSSSSINDADEGGGDFLDYSDGFDVPSPSL